MITRPYYKRMFGGICAGISDYFGVDVTTLRIFWFASIFAYGVGIFLYIIMMMVLPDEEIDNYKKNF